MPTHDEAFKKLIERTPVESFTAFAAEHVAALGVPVSAEVIPNEVLPHVPGQQRSRFFDVAIRFTWPDGSQRLMLLVEHWSHGRDIDLVRVLMYTAELMRRYPDIPIMPVMVVADGSVRESIRDRLAMDVAGNQVLDFRVTIFMIRAELLPRWAATHNPVLAVLAALLRDLPPPAVALRSCELLLHNHKLTEIINTQLHLIEIFANLTNTQLAEFHHRLREEPTMASIVDILKAEGLAEGEARGEANSFVRLVLDGDLSRTKGIARLQHLHEQGRITTQLLQETLAIIEASA